MVTPSHQAECVYVSFLRMADRVGQATPWTDCADFTVERAFGVLFAIGRRDSACKQNFSAAGNAASVCANPAGLASHSALALADVLGLGYGIVG